MTSPEALLEFDTQAMTTHELMEIVHVWIFCANEIYQALKDAAFSVDVILREIK